MSQNYKKILHQITTFVFDVDGVLTDGKLLVTTDGQLLRTMFVRDGFALKHAVKSGFRVCVISGGKNEGVRKRLEGLGLSDIYLGIDDKTRYLQNFFDNHGIDKANVAYMGDDLPDSHPMKLVGLPTCPQDAAPEVKQISKYISHCRGGEGCVRDLIEQVLKIQEKWQID